MHSICFQTLFYDIAIELWCTVHALMFARQQSLWCAVCVLEDSPASSVIVVFWVCKRFWQHTLYDQTPLQKLAPKMQQQKNNK